MWINVYAHAISLIRKHSSDTYSAMMASMQGFDGLFKGKKVTLLGLGLLGRGVGDAEFLAKSGAHVIVSDRKSEAELAPSIERLRHFDNIEFHLGGHKEVDFTQTDLVLKAAGVRLDSKEVAAARAAGVPVIMSTAFFAKAAMELGAKIVGVTGTRGKSTISHMLYHVLKAHGSRVHLGGNVRGISTLAMLPEVRPGDIVVLELDSWQLQGFGDLAISPHIAVFTNLMPDHQNYYRTMDEYFADKAHIFLYQKPGDTLVVGERIADKVRAASASRRTPVEPVVPGELPKDWRLHVVGHHNRYNASLAASALLALGVTASEIQTGLESFQGIEGRLQYMGEKNGIRIYNDNNATTPEATLAAIRGLDEGKKNIVLIMGGSDKGLEMKELWEEVLAKCKDLFFLSGSGIDRIRPEAPHVPAYDSLDEAFKAALAASAPGDILLFSPAFASFGMFQNEYDRNDQFVKLVQAL